MRSDFAVRGPAEAGLKMFYGIYERSLIHRGVRRDVRLSGKITDQMEKLSELRDAGISVAWSDSFSSWRKWLAVVFLRVLQIRVQCLNRALVTRIGRLDLREDRGDIGRVHDICFHELRQIVFLGLDIEAKIEMFGIHLADVQVRDVAHHANGERGIELHCVCFRRL